MFKVKWLCYEVFFPQESLLPVPITTRHISTSPTYLPPPPPIKLFPPPPPPYILHPPPNYSTNLRTQATHFIIYQATPHIIYLPHHQLTPLI